MFLNEFNQTPIAKIGKLNKLLNEQFGITIKAGATSKVKLEKVLATAEKNLQAIRENTKKFQLDPDYVKFLGIKDIVNTMLSESMYAESPAYESMCNEVKTRVRELMDSGYTTTEAASQCMNEYRKDSRWCYDDAVIMPVVEMACEEYVHECSESKMDLENVVAEVSVEDQIQLALDEGDVDGARLLMSQLREKKAKPDYIDIDGDGDTKEPMKKAVKDKKNESMFDDIINQLLNEEVDVEQAEVVMAVRALADDIQDQIERIGRMMNEDVPAIADQMRSEMGAAQAQSWSDSTNQSLSTHLESAKATKATMDQSVAGLTGDEPVGGLGDTGMGTEPALGGDAMNTDLSVDDSADNIPAAAGPEEAPLGRAEV